MDYQFFNRGQGKTKPSSSISDDIFITKMSAETACSHLFFLRAELQSNDQFHDGKEVYKQLKTYTDGFLIIGKKETEEYSG
jgi:hypothetical protein